MAETETCPACGSETVEAGFPYRDGLRRCPNSNCPVRTLSFEEAADD